MREFHRALLQELTAAGVRPRLRRTRGDHVRIEWELHGKSYSVVTGSTPSDHRALSNARATIRRQLRRARDLRCATK